MAAILQVSPRGWAEDGRARASDAQLQHALNRAGYLSPTVKQLWDRGEVTVFEANCAGTVPHVLTLLCSRLVCRIDEPESDPDKLTAGPPNLKVANLSFIRKLELRVEILAVSSGRSTYPPLGGLPS